MRTTAAIIGLALAAGAPAVAQMAPDDIQTGYVGRWKLEVRPGGGGCTLRFTDQGSIGGYAIAGQEGCARRWPELADLGVWSFHDNAIVLQDGMRHKLLSFEEEEGAPYEARRRRGGTWRLTSLEPPLSAAEQMSGTWTLNDAGVGPVCAYRFTSKAGGREGAATPTGKPCREPWSKMAVWKKTGQRMKLSAADGSTARTFEQSDEITWSLVGVKQADALDLQWTSRP